jgi:transaldolase
MYVEELVAPGTVNTMPEATLHATAAHGELRGDAIHGTYTEARQIIDDLEGLGIGYDDVVGVLEEEGTAKFAASWHELLATIETEMAAAAGR